MADILPFQATPQPEFVVVTPDEHGRFTVAVHDADGRPVQGFEIMHDLPLAGAEERAAALSIAADVPSMWLDAPGNEDWTVFDSKWLGPAWLKQATPA
jgi:hypothetical protein